jgi:hypothetical protein
VSHSLHFIRRLALRAKGPKGRARATADITVYGGSSTSAKSFFVHHTQQLAAARCAGGRREGDPEEDHRDEDAGVIKDALKATGRG